MAPANTARVTLEGALPGGEVFNTSFWVSPTVIGQTIPATNSAAQTFLDTLATSSAFTTWTGVLKGLWNAPTFLTGVSLYCYPTGGSTAVAIARRTIATAGGTGGGNLPNQVCRVVTLLTGQAGRSFRGRMYIPATGLPVAAGGALFTDAGVGTVNAFGAFFSAIKTLALMPDGSGVFAGVASGTRNAFTPATVVRTDNKPDIQRRRANRETGVVFNQAVITV